MKSIRILVVTHKKYDMPNDKQLYLPIQSGSAIHEDLGIQRDDEGDNISDKNLLYNELCPMYCAWKNLDSDYIGMVHYRRHFSKNSKNLRSYEDILTYEEANKLTDKYDIILPHKKKYLFSTVKKHYQHCKAGYEEIHTNDLKVLRNVICNLRPEYVTAFDKVMNGNSAHMLHICLMRRDRYDEYCNFVFPVMKECELLLRDRPDALRFIGALSEFLMDVWLETNNYKYYELGLVELEKQNIVKRVIAVCKRKYFNR